MANIKKTQKLWDEIDGLKNQLINDIFPNIKQTKSDLDIYTAELLVDNEDRESIKSSFIISIKKLLVVL